MTWRGHSMGTFGLQTFKLDVVGVQNVEHFPILRLSPIVHTTPELAATNVPIFPCSWPIVVLVMAPAADAALEEPKSRQPTPQPPATTLQVCFHMYTQFSYSHSYLAICVIFCFLASFWPRATLLGTTMCTRACYRILPGTNHGIYPVPTMHAKKSIENFPSSF